VLASLIFLIETMTAELCTDLGDKIKIAFESTRDFGPESIIFFRPSGVELVGNDHAHVVDIRFLMSAEKIRETGGTYKYESPDPQIRLGIRTKVVAGALKRFSPGDTVIIGAKIGVDREFYVVCKNKGKLFRSEIVAPLLDVESDVPVNLKDKISYNCSITMGSNVFHSIIGDLLTADPPVINFTSDGKTLKMSGEGRFSKSAVEIGDSTTIGDDGGPSAEFAKRTNIKDEVCENFATTHLQRISKSKNISNRITISVIQGAPASFDYDTPIGTLSYLVCPRTVEDIDDPRLRPPVDTQPAKKKRFTIDYGSDGMEDVA
jgi:hypothetical protein